MDVWQHVENIKSMSLAEVLVLRTRVSMSTASVGDKRMLNGAMDERVDKLEAHKDAIVVSCEES